MTGPADRQGRFNPERFPIDDQRVYDAYIAGRKSAAIAAAVRAGLFDLLAGGVVQRKRICRTFSDCTTGPRNGMISGCFPLDPHYKAMPEAAKVKQLREGAK